MMSNARNTKGTIVIGATESDAHVVSLYLVAIMLEECGYSVINRTCQNPIAELLSVGNSDSPIMAFVLCNQNGQAAEDLKDLRRYKTGASPIILGGHYTLGCHNRLEQQRYLYHLGVDHLVDTLDELVPLLDTISAQQSEREGVR